MTTENDRNVLDNIFSPLLPNCNLLPEMKDNSSCQANTTEEVPEEIIQLEVDGVKAAEDGATDLAIELFTAAIAQTPDRASCYNNRAQALQLKGDIDGALEDLNKAISLLPSDEKPGKVANSVYTQRGIVHQLKGDMSSAMEDYKKGASLGNSFAKQQVIANNPMAAMCNKMLGEVMLKLRQGKPIE